MNKLAIEHALDTVLECDNTYGPETLDELVDIFLDAYFAELNGSGIEADAQVAAYREGTNADSGRAGSDNNNRVGRPARPVAEPADDVRA